MLQVNKLHYLKFYGQTRRSVRPEGKTIVQLLNAAWRLQYIQGGIILW